MVVAGSDRRSANSQVAMNPNRIRVLVVDDHPVLREGVAVLVSQQPDLLMVGEASTGREAVEHAKTHVKNILAKLSANDRTHAVTLALRRGIIQL
jgi:DNA-binding NarL/FixJ family response regulator